MRTLEALVSLQEVLPPGKVPPELLRRMLSDLPGDDSVVLGPGIGRDVALVRAGAELLALTSDPISFAADEIGWYAVHVNANDLATVGAEPRWFLATVLLPEGTNWRLVESIVDDIASAARQIGVIVVGGHTEMTGGLDRPIVCGTMIGSVPHTVAVRPDGLKPGDAVLLTKGTAVEATAIIAREMPERLRAAGLTDADVAEAAKYLHDPGISVLRDGTIARSAGDVHAMHDPTEGGVVTALDELAEASSVGIEVDADVLERACTPLTARVCRAVGIDPLGAISSGALLIGVSTPEADAVAAALREAGIPVHRIGLAVSGLQGCRFVGPKPRRWPRFPVDEIARLLAE